MAFLGYPIATADGGADREDLKISYADLMKRDILEPMGMSDSHFLATEENRHIIMVLPLVPEVTVRPHPSHLPRHN